MTKPKSITILLLLALCACFSVRLFAAELNGGSDCDINGGLAEVPIMLINDAHISGLQFDVLYDAAEVSPMSLVGGNALVDHLFDWNEVASGQLRVVVYSPTNTPFVSGTVVAIRFGIDSGSVASTILLELPLDSDPVYAGPGVLLANTGGVKNLPDPEPIDGVIDLVQFAGPSPAVACIGGQAAFEVSVIAPGTTTYQWRRDGIPIPGENLPQFTVAVAEPESAAGYSCDIDNDICGGFSSSSAFLLVSTFPCPPEVLSAYDYGYGSTLATLWTRNPSTSVDKYTLYWGTSQGGPYPFKREFPVANVATLDGLQNGTRYFFRVSASVQGVEGPFSNESEAVPTAGGLDLPQAPDYGYETTPGGDLAHPDLVTYRFPGRTGDVTVWYDAYDVDSLDEVSVSVNGHLVETLASTSSGSWMGLSTLILPGEIVHDDQTNVLTFNNELSPPSLGEPWGVRNVSIKLPAPIISSQPWSETVDLSIAQIPAEPTLAHYDVFRSTNPGFTPNPTNLIATGFSDGSFRDGTASPNDTDFYYKVRPVDTISNRGFDSAEELATPNASAVTPVHDLRVAKSGGSDLQLSWSTVSTEGGVFFYRIYEGSAPSILAPTGEQTPFTSLTQATHQSDGMDHYYLIGVVDTTGRESDP